MVGFSGDGRFAHFLFVAMNLQTLIEQTVTGLDYELVDLEMSPKGRTLRVFIDTQAEGGINVDDCVTVSNQLSRVLMVENIDYDRLEVSSPGLDRPLKKLADFERFAGQQVNVKVRMAIGNRRNFSGLLQGVREGKVCLLLDAGEVELDPANIDKARLVPQFD